MAMYDDQRTYVDGLVDFLTSDKSQQFNQARSLA